MPSADGPPPAHSHRRRNPLSGEWVLVSPQRLNRPWQGAHSTPVVEQRPAYDPACYLCPGNTRANGMQNPDYSGVYVFDNDFAALQDPSAVGGGSDDPLFGWAAEQGTCRVLCFSPDHHRTLSELGLDEVAAVVDAWAEQSRELGARYPDGAVQVFENKGELMGCSNPHPHGQVWAQHGLPTLLARELACCREHHAAHGQVLLLECVQRELAVGERVVCANDSFVAIVPFWATWPFETLVLPRRHLPRLPLASAAERRDLADLFRRLSLRCDNLFGVPFPYSAGLHQAPASGAWDASFQMHLHLYPPLLRSADVRKFMVGYEMLAESQRDLTPEAAAKVLREQPEAPLG